MSDPNPEGLVERLRADINAAMHGAYEAESRTAMAITRDHLTNIVLAQFEKRLAEVEGDLRDAECRPLLGELELALRRAESAEQQLERVREGDG